MTFNVYYLDDEKDLCENFIDFFASEEIHVTTFTEPKKLIEAVKINLPQLIFLDYRLPHKNGDEIALELNNNIPKILMTGEINIVTKYNFDKIVYKPFKVEEVMMILSQYTRRK